MFSDGNGQQTALQSARQALAGDISDTELAWLARSPEVKVRAAAAAHPRMALTLLLKLAEDASVDVRMAVASNPRTGIPLELHEDLAKDKNVDVVFALIANPAVPDALIARLGRQIHREYAKEARARMARTRRGEPVAVPEPVATPEPTPSVPAFPTVGSGARVERAPVAQSKSDRDDALDVLLGGR